MTEFAVGIDIGGTFTDVVALDLKTGKYATAKVLTTPENPQLGAINGVDKILEQIGDPKQIKRLVHATTLFSNALIERKGAKTGLITTMGFKDTLQLGRERKYDIYDLFLTYPSPLVPTDLRYEIKERISSDGEVLTPLDEKGLMKSAKELQSKGVTSIAISFLNSNARPEHEKLASQLLAKNFPDLSLTLSSDISQESGEFERTSTAAINAYIKPLAAEYIGELELALKNRGSQAPLMLMLSNGGLTNTSEAKHRPVDLLESGPAGGALSAALIGKLQNEERLIAFDMGGTTAKIAIIDNGQPEVSYSFEAARERRFAPGSGLPVRITTVELVEIGAGGGSIATKDALNLLKVGPQSAGSMPGPICYNQGGSQPTVTDADLQLGYLSVEGFSESSLDIDPIKTSLSLDSFGAEFDLDANDIALGIHDVVCENMAQAAQIHLARKGRDPRDYSLYATGGAAPVHACAVAKRLGIKRVIIPPAAGVASALGLTVAPARADKSVAISRPLSSLDARKIKTIYESLQTTASEVVRASVPNKAIKIQCLAELRYSGQGAVLVVDITKAFTKTKPHKYINDEFHKLHKVTYGRAFEHHSVELMTARVSASASTTRNNLQPMAQQENLKRSKIQKRKIRLPNSTKNCNVNVYRRETLSAGKVIRGPAIIEEGQSTTVVPENTKLTVSPQGGLVIDILDTKKLSKKLETDLNNPIHLEILWNQLISAVDEAAASLLRSAFSTVVRESYDFSCVVTDEQGNALVQATDSIPSFIGTLPDTVKHFIRRFPSETLFPGDILITNDPHMGTGHLPDISVCRPIFNGAKIIGFAASTAHAPDIGGKIRSPEPREVFEEGLQIPPMKLYEKGEINKTLMSIIRQNVRVSDQVEGDLEAQLGALFTINQRILQITDTYQLKDLSKLSAVICERTEQAVRSAIKGLPDGEYYSTVKTDGLADLPVEIKVLIKIAGDTLEADFSGSSSQVNKAVNCPLCYTRAMTSYAIKSALAPELPNNEGALKPLKLIAPPSSIVNPSHPASVGSRVLTGHFIPALIMHAISEIAPEKILAGSGSPIWCVNLNGYQVDGTRIAGLFFFNGGMGASSSGDGLSCTSWPSNISSTPIEEIEQRYPVRFKQRSLRSNSGGNGAFKGGDGQTVEFQYIGKKPGVFAFLAERTKIPASGIAGGEDGVRGRLELNGDPIDPKLQHVVNPGDYILLATPGGGGYGRASSKD